MTEDASLAMGDDVLLQDPLSSASTPEHEPSVEPQVDRLEQARKLRAFVDRIEDERDTDPISFLQVNVGALQRQYLLAAGVDALIDLAESTRELAAWAAAQRIEWGPPVPSNG